ncbi:MAG TPA: helicase HerA-like domain-containing protein [Solirubrobacteraceae bacterium]|jgi:hypothetical protein|nr:helicase HerA-like domain-containing protein [Solirubrobacteraceae bacterium]
MNIRNFASAPIAGETLPHETHQLAALGGQLLCAAALGAAGAVLLRRRSLHWTWALAALALAVLLAPLLGGAGRISIVVAAVAAFRARRRHRDDLEAGADLARSARARLTPLGAARILAARLGGSPAIETLPGMRRAPSGLRARTTLPGIGRGPSGLGARTTLPGIRRAASVLAPDRARGDSGTLLLGRDTRGRTVRIPFGAGVTGHALIVGATGSGKTVTQTLLAERAIADGRAVIAVDPKGDAAMRDRLGAAALRAGRRFVEWTPAGPSTYNPYSRGGETEIADRLLAGEHFTEPHYLRQAQRYLGHAIRALRACGREVSLAAIVEMLDPTALEAALREAHEHAAESGHSYLDSLTPRQLRDLAGIRDRLAILAESEVGRWLRGGGSDSFELLSACRSASVVYFGLEADSRPLVAQMLGAAIVQDLQSTVAALQSSPAPALAAIDEFSALGARHVTALFGRARSAGISLVLGTQEISDLRVAGAEHLLERVLGNVSLLVAHRQVVPASAELLGRMAGTRGCWRVSWGGRGTTRTRGFEPVLEPEALMSLAPGWGVVISFGAARSVATVRVRACGGER